uniref:Uncharacterized protein n=1 Tax=Timema bartmani TaxID=61472 RepID=A0A7R9ETG5_9NEOP|nr:unnamed protein product [Timema bartmani]
MLVSVADSVTRAAGVRSATGQLPPLQLEGKHSLGRSPADTLTTDLTHKGSVGVGRPLLRLAVRGHAATSHRADSIKVRHQDEIVFVMMRWRVLSDRDPRQPSLLTAYTLSPHTAGSHLVSSETNTDTPSSPNKNKGAININERRIASPFVACSVQRFNGYYGSRDVCSTLRHAATKCLVAKQNVAFVLDMLALSQRTRMVSELHENAFLPRFLPQPPPTQVRRDAPKGNNSSLEASKVPAWKSHKTVP